MMHIRWLILDMGDIMGIKTSHGDELWGQHWKVWMNLIIVCGRVQVLAV